MIAAIYARKSTEQNGVGDEEKSVNRQIDHARAYAERKGWSVADEHDPLSTSFLTRGTRRLSGVS